jgi:hypothetical protein
MIQSIRPAHFPEVQIYSVEKNYFSGVIFSRVTKL